MEQKLWNLDYMMKRSKINIGDQIEFSKLPDLQETILVDVLDLYRDNTFEIYLKNYLMMMKK